MTVSKFWRSRGVVAIAVAALMLCVSAAEAATAWSSPPTGPGASGSNARFGWSGGENNYDPVIGPGFGNPTAHLWGFYFENTVDFRAEGGGDTTQDVARVTIDKAGASGPADPFPWIAVREYGTYFGDPSFFTVQADFAVMRYSPLPPGPTGPVIIASSSQPPTFVPDFPENPALGGYWYAQRTLTAGAPGNPPYADVQWNRFKITVTDTVQVSGSATEGSWIEKTGMKIIIPEPTSVLLMLTGFGSLALRRSRRS
ncbi:MAG: PEP-CTERM sorting domain-containing protein [Planctomycetota bacterium]